MEELNFTKEDGFYVAVVETQGNDTHIQVNRKYFPYPHDYSLEVLGRIDPSMPWAPVQMFDYKSPRNIIIHHDRQIDEYQLKLRSRTEVESAMCSVTQPRLFLPKTIRGASNPVLHDGSYLAYYVLKFPTDNRYADLYNEDGDLVDGGAVKSASPTLITEQIVSDIPELSIYQGMYLDVVTCPLQGLFGNYWIEYFADGFYNDVLEFLYDGKVVIPHTDFDDRLNPNSSGGYMSFKLCLRNDGGDVSLDMRESDNPGSVIDIRLSENYPRQVEDGPLAGYWVYGFTNTSPSAYVGRDYDCIVTVDGEEYHFSRVKMNAY